MMAPVRRDLPSGTVTFLFTDVEGSTRLLHELGAEGYGQALAEHRRVLREAFAAQGGLEVDTQGDAFFVAFPTGPGALGAAAEWIDGLAAGPIRVRIGIHTGTPHVTDEGYVGVDVHRAARIAAAGHGGQVLVSASTAALVGADELRDLGEHRLKDLSAPERIYQIGDDDFPALKSLYRTNLPIPATPFLGRERELTKVVGLLSGEDVRLLTLTGPGGTGKTRLGLQAAAEASERYPDGIFWVPLAPLRDPELVLATAGQALGARDGLADHITDKSLLLLLDNFEHVVDAAPGLADLLAACPNLHLLVTSRDLLRLPGEQAYPVPPLEPPDGTELFLTRARAADPGFVSSDVVPELCAELEHLPLALELAAARIRVLSPEQLLERLSSRLDLLRAGRGVDPRQQTLRATIEWSYELLDGDERRLFARLAVFRGGCTLESAEDVCGADLDTLQSLVDKSLVRVREGGRFWMLETIREYAHELLEGGGEGEAVRRRHADHYLALAELAYAERFDRGLTWVRRLEPEHDNLRAALDHLLDRDPLCHLQLVGALGWFWLARSHFAEGSRRLEDGLASPAAEGRLTARALTYLGAIDATRGRSATALSRLERATELWHTVGDETELAAARDELGWALFEGGEDELRALELFQQNLEHARRLGHHELVSRSLAGVCQMLVVTGQFERAEPLALELYASMRDSEDVVYMCAADHYLADCAMHRRDYTLAERHRLGALETALTSETVMQQAIEIQGLALTAAGLGRDEEALRLEGAVDAKYAELGAAGLALLPFYATWRERDLGAARARLGEPRATAAFDEGRAMTWDQAIELALASQVAPLVRAVQ
jgi:predicted ATPase/class 3 adenylate cyclase